MAEDEKVEILLVDDQPGKLLTYEAILGDLGHHLIKAHSGREALEILLERDIGVVLMDVCMPNLDGFELAELIHQHPRCSHTAIIFISAVHMTNLDQLRGYAAGAVDYVSVPVVPEILRARVTVFADLYRKTRQLERLNRELELRVEARTRELEADLRERRRLESELKHADRRKDEFLAILSHELRNPLAPIRSAVEILRRTVAGDPQVVWCHDVIERQVESLTRLVDDLLDVSRITRGKVQITKERVAVATILARAVETVRPVIDRREQDLTVEMPARTLEVDGDTTRLAQVVGNLIHNAAKYTPAGGRIRVCVRSEKPADGRGASVVIRVEDTGVGIPPEQLPHLFQLFTQMDHSLDRSEGGLGIGLALVRLLVEMHGGTVSAWSDGVGMGSAFTIRLPLVAGSAPVEQVLAPSDALAMGGVRRRILVADDNRDAAEALAESLRLCGAEVVTTHDGVEALAVAETFLPDLALLDIGMPRMHGYEAARRIRAESWGKTMLLIAQTGWGQEEDRRRSHEAGFDGHLTKPVDFSKLIALLAHMDRKMPGPMSVP